MAIESEAGARRLALAMLSDVRSYAAKEVAGRQEPRIALAAEIAEARELFQERVAPELHANWVLRRSSMP